ncbi:MBL fold metallo-hydrolase [Deinococcus deserti]|uniref:Putative metallo-beta-lactamase n=1 Tax=Deinococcus deserti (strain DSM 17065 / CIP 109153 / LMG 22923 / VCD115) TaxID=546414 RepID=C1CUY3_DEIDV|nr:MBL fold metallo-hydrolase [Deinococcus deserti]ACO46000.1 putative metallo-beta-lactamase [Deinococcus deserti VCD115]
MNGPQLIDLHFQETPGVIAAHVLDTGDGLALVDPGPGSTLDALEAGLNTLGAELSDVRHVLLTHIHFDHAGAAGTVLARVPRARVYVHGRGAGHLVSPERLVASATQIYGDQMDRLWGVMQPVDQDRLTPLEDGQTLRLGRAEARVLYTPGHAVHHVAYHIGDDLFVGDVGGVRLDPRQTPRAPTPPPDIQLDDWKQSISTLRVLDARTLQLTHFGAHPQEAAHWDGLLNNMELDASRIREGMERGQSFEAISEEYTEVLMAELAAEGIHLPARYEFACPPWMSVQGLMRYWQRQSVRSGRGDA